MKNINSFFNGVLISIGLFVIWFLIGEIAIKNNYFIYFGYQVYKIFEIINLILSWLIFSIIIYVKRKEKNKDKYTMFVAILLYLLFISSLQIILPPSISPQIN